MVVVAPGRTTNDADVILLAFIDSEAASGGRRASDVSVSALKDLIRRELGAVHVPHRVEIFPLHPRWKKGQVDAEWCRSQYLSGTLTTKRRMPVFLTLSRLSWIFGTGALEE